MHCVSTLGQCIASLLWGNALRLYIGAMQCVSTNGGCLFSPFFISLFKKEVVG
jgi:hypothetical protein